MNTDVRNLAQVISVEALAGVNPTAILNRFPQFFSSVLSGCEQALAGLRPGHAPDHPAVVKELMKKLQGKSYSKLSEMNVYAPAGMEGTYLEYIAYLKSVIERAAGVPAKVVRPYAQWVGSLLSSPSRLASLNTSMIPSVEEAFFHGSGGTALADLLDRQSKGKPGHVTYGSAIARNADWPTVYEEVGSLEAMMSVTPTNVFTQQVADLGHNVNRLIGMIKNDPDTYKTSGAMLDKLASATLDVAQTIEYYAAAYYLLRQLETALDDTKSKLIAALS